MSETILLQNLESYDECDLYLELNTMNEYKMLVEKYFAKRFWENWGESKMI
jgi:hypothetical protein